MENWLIYRTPKDIYILNEARRERCYMGQVDQSWLSHKRMGYINFDNLVLIRKKNCEKLALNHETCQPHLQGMQDWKEGQGQLQN